MPASLTQQAQARITRHFTGGDADLPTQLAVDATCGNGHDSLFLARLGFVELLALDVQAAAISATRALLESNSIDESRYRVIQAGHESLTQRVSGSIDCVMFNLGYLPGANKERTTVAETTLSALDQAVGLLSPTGFISVMCYPGHADGASEAAAVCQWLESLPADQWQIERIESVNHNARTPFLLTLRHQSNQEETP